MGSLDMAYPRLILSTAAAAMGPNVSTFVIFYGLGIIKKGDADNLKISPIRNPVMLMPAPNSKLLSLATEKG